jgi:putative PIN family toxin of toxin-antitoxin system
VKVCLDSNVLVSGFATRGLAADVVRVALARQELLVPEIVLREVVRALERKIGLPAATVAAVEQLLRTHPVIAKPGKPPAVRVRDPDDAWVVAAAVAGNAEVLVTGDADLLALGEAAPLPIVTPRAFWEQVRNESGGS